MLRNTFLIFLLVTHFQLAGQSQTLDTLVNLGSHQLHFRIIQGSGTPILFESGNGDDGSVWNPLLEDIHKATGATLITYDRAGLGKSSMDTTHVSFAQEVADLGVALKALGYDRELFIAAHSFGSFYASAFARDYAHPIKGAVFIDVATPCGFDVAYATRVKESITPPLWKVIKQYKKGLYYVIQNLPETAAYLSDRFMPSSIPMTVIAAGIREPNADIGETQIDMRKFTGCLEALGNQPGNRFVLAKEAEHKVWKQSPELVKNEIIVLYKETTNH